MTESSEISSEIDTSSISISDGLADLLARINSYSPPNSDDDEQRENLYLNSSTRQKSSTNRLVSCPICLESTSLQTSPCCTFSCCLSCWHSHISTILNDGRIQISCPGNECNKYLPREIILSLIRLDLNLQERYLKLYVIANQTPFSKTCASI